MSNFLKKISFVYDFMTDRYTCRQAKLGEMKTLYALRREVFGNELKRWKNKEKFCPAREDEFDPKSIHFVCRDNTTDEIVGAVRITCARHFKNSPEYFKEYQLELFPEKMLSQIYVVSRLIVAKNHRASPAAMLLASKCYEQGMNSNVNCFISVVVCEPNLYPLYRRLGYRPLSKVSVSPFGGYRLPLFMVTHDYDNLRQANSPFLKIAKGYRFPTRRKGLDWLKQMSQKNSLIDPGFSLITTATSASFHSQITQGLSKKAKKQLLDRAIEINCCYGDQIINKGSGGRNIGFVKKGALEIRNGKKTLGILGEGDLFGEVAFLLDIPRTADVVAAADDTEIVLLTLSAINKLTDKADTAKLWQNVAKILALRLVNRSN